MRTLTILLTLLTLAFSTANAIDTPPHKVIQKELNAKLKSRSTPVLDTDLTIPAIRLQTLDPESIFTPTLIATILQEPSLKVLKRSLDPSDADSFLALQEIVGGTYSGQVRIITITDKSALTAPNLPLQYIVKEVVWRHDQVFTRAEQTPLKELQSIRVVAKAVVPKLEAARARLPHLPAIPATRGVLKIFTPPPREHESFIAVMDMAPGDDGYTIFDNYQDGNDADGKELSDAMKEFGRAIGSFHFLFADPITLDALNGNRPSLFRFKTTIHGDLHFGNLLWSAGHPVQLIDVATMADSVNKKEPAVSELIYSFLHAKYAMYLGSQLGLNWVNSAFESFAEGYANEVSPRNSANVKAAIVALYRSLSRDFKNRYLKIATDKSSDISAFAHHWVAYYAGDQKKRDAKRTSAEVDAIKANLEHDDLAR